MRQAGGEPVLLGQALTQAGTSTSRYRDVAEAEQYHDEALSVLRRCGRTKLLAYALLCAGGMPQGCRGFAGCAGARRRGAGSCPRRSVISACTTSARCNSLLIAFAAGQMAEAIDRARRAVETSRRHGTLAAEFTALQLGPSMTTTAIRSRLVERLPPRAPTKARMLGVLRRGRARFGHRGVESRPARAEGLFVGDPTHKSNRTP